MIDLEVLTPLVGQSFVFSPKNTNNFAAVRAQFYDGQICKVRVTYNGQDSFGKSIALGDEIIVSFDALVVFPPGICIVFDCDDAPADTGCKDEELTLTADTRLAVLDDKGCLKGWVKLGDLIKKAVNLCELYGYKNGIPKGHLVAGDRILTVDDNCELKSIPPSDIVC